MSDHHPFKQDPSATAAFAALHDLPPVVPASERLRAVVIGGGTGAPMSIRALLSLGLETSAVVAMADDGGSTGILRAEANVTPPGDVRKCIAAFARNPNDPLTRAFKYRFEFARDHTLGNLMLAALEDASGSFPEAVRICERLLDARGHVYPSTLDRVTLVARARDGVLLEGQAKACASHAALEQVWLRSPGGMHPYEPALAAIREADLIVLGPGSLFTSIIPNLLVPGMVDAIRASRGRVLFVCSLADMQGETRGLTALGHVQALMDHGMRGLVDYMLVHVPASPQSGQQARACSPVGAGDGPACDSQQNSDQPAARPFAPLANASDEPCGVPLAGRDGNRTASLIRPVSLTSSDVAAIQACGTMVIARDLVDPLRPTWHEPGALCEAFSGVLKLCRSRRK